MTRNFVYWWTKATAIVAASSLGLVLAIGTASGQATTDPSPGPPMPPATDSADADKTPDSDKSSPATTPKTSDDSTATKTPDYPPPGRDPSSTSPEDFRNAARDQSRSTSEEFRNSVRDQERSTTEEFRNRVREPRDGDPPDRPYGSRVEREDRTNLDRDNYYRERYSRDERDYNDDRNAQDRNVRDRDVRDRDVRGSDFSERRDMDREDARFRASAEFRADAMRGADIGLWFDRSTQDGLVISDIGTSGAITRLGFREGDRIYSVNGIRVDSERDFIRQLFDSRWRNDRVTVIIHRYGKPWSVYVHPHVFVQEYTTVAHDPLEHCGLVLDDRYDDYIVVWRVIPRSPAFYAGIRPGDVITTFQGRRLRDRDDFVRQFQEGNLDSIALEVNRNRQTRRFDVDLAGSARVSSRTALRPDFDAESNRFDGDPNRRDNIDVRRDGTRDDQGFDTRTTAPGYGAPGRIETYQPAEVQGGIQGTVQPMVPTTSRPMPERRGGIFNRGR